MLYSKNQILCYLVLYLENNHETVTKFFKFCLLDLV